MRQFPSSALHDPQLYADQLADMHRRWDPIAIAGIALGSTLVDLFDRVGFFRVFSSIWFVALLSLLVVSIICCTLDRTPRLWRGVRLVNVEQPDPFFDLRLSERAVVEHNQLAPGDVAAMLKRRHFVVRQATDDADGAATTWVYGDRNQYFKLATLLTHLGLILFLLGAAVTAAFGFETVLFVAEGQTAPVQPVGTPHNLLVKNIAFEAPRRADGSFEDFRTDLAVYQDGQQIARKTIRVNDPLQTGGFVFHQNTFGPTADLDIRDASGRLVWTGPVILEDNADLGFPAAFQTIPGADMGLQLFLQRADDGTGVLAVVGIGVPPDGGEAPILFALQMGVGATSDPADSGGYQITWTGAGAWTGMVIKNDPGQGIIWIAFLSLISGLVLSFYFPRRRVWARFAEGRLQLAMLADRYVDVNREFGALLDDVAARGGTRPLSGPAG